MNTPDEGRLEKVLDDIAGLLDRPGARDAVLKRTTIESGPVGEALLRAFTDLFSMKQSHPLYLEIFGRLSRWWLAQSQARDWRPSS